METKFKRTSSSAARAPVVGGAQEGGCSTHPLSTLPCPRCKEAITSHDETFRCPNCLSMWTRSSRGLKRYGSV